MSSEISAVLRAIRARRGMTQMEISTAMRVHRTYWSVYERGIRSPSLVMIARMRRYIGLTDDEALDLVGAAEKVLDGEGGGE